jgi:hypothetical protein
MVWYVDLANNSSSREFLSWVAFRIYGYESDPHGGDFNKRYHMQKRVATNPCYVVHHSGTVLYGGIQRGVSGYPCAIPHWCVQQPGLLYLLVPTVIQ